MRRTHTYDYSGLRIDGKIPGRILDVGDDSKLLNSEMSKDKGRDGKAFFAGDNILRQDVRHENRGLQRIAGCGSEVGANIDKCRKMARGRQGGAEAQDQVERGGPSVIWASTSARNLDVGTGKTRKERISIEAARHNRGRKKKAGAAAFRCAKPQVPTQPLIFGSEGASGHRSVQCPSLWLA
jgi:hypothetical protein